MSESLYGLQMSRVSSVKSWDLCPRYPVDFLCKDFDVVARCQEGNNAGNTVSRSPGAGAYITYTDIIQHLYSHSQCQI